MRRRPRPHRSCGPQGEFKDHPARLAFLLFVEMRPTCNVFGPAPKRRQIETHVTRFVRTDLRGGLMEEAGRAPGVTLGSLRVPGAPFESGGGEANKALEESGPRATAAARAPQPFPGLMSFPVEAVVEEIDAVQIVRAGAPILKVRRRRVLVYRTVAMSIGIACRMRRAAGHVTVGRKCAVRGEPWRRRCRRVGHGGFQDITSREAGGVNGRMYKRVRGSYSVPMDQVDDRLRTITAEELALILEAHELYVASNKQSGRQANLDATDLSGRSFVGKKLWRIRMRRADLGNADLTGADLRHALLVGARMQRATLAAADLSRARLGGIDLSDAACQGACLAEADIEFGILANADLRTVDLHDADLSGAVLDGADLSRAKLRGANLRGVSFRKTRLDGADLSNARMGGAFFIGTSLKGANLAGAYLRVAQFDRADLSGADLRGVIGLTWAQIEGTIRDADTRLPENLTIGARDGD